MFFANQTIVRYFSIVREMGILLIFVYLGDRCAYIDGLCYQLWQNKCDQWIN